MASVEDAPERLRSLARKIDPETLQHLGVSELRVRLESAADLYEDIARTDNEHERNRLRKEADLILSAISLRAFIAGAKVLTDAIADSKRQGGGRAELELTKQFDRLYKNNPQPGMTVPEILAEISTVNVAAAKSPRWKFWKGAK